MSNHDVFSLPEKLVQYQQEHSTVYQWKRLFLRERLDTVHQSRLRENGWRPVPLSRHPESGLTATQDQSPQPWVPEELAQHYTDCVVRGDEILMERSREVQDRAVQEDRQRAEHQLVSQFERMGMDQRDSRRRVYVSVPGTSWSFQEWFWFRTWWLVWRIGLPARWILSQRERQVALKSYGFSGWWRAYQTYALNKAALITEGRL